MIYAIIFLILFMMIFCWCIIAGARENDDEEQMQAIREWVKQNKEKK